MAALITLLGDGIEPCVLAGRVSGLSDADTVAVAEASAAIIRGAELAQVAAAGVFGATVPSREPTSWPHVQRARRGSRVWRSRGHRTSTSLLQALTGSAKADAPPQSAGQRVGC